MEQTTFLEFKSHDVLFIILVSLIVFVGAFIVFVVGYLSRRFLEKHYQEGPDASTTTTTSTSAVRPR